MHKFLSSFFSATLNIPFLFLSQKDFEFWISSSLLLEERETTHRPKAKGERERAQTEYKQDRIKNNQTAKRESDVEYRGVHQKRLLDALCFLERFF